MRDILAECISRRLQCQPRDRSYVPVGSGHAPSLTINAVAEKRLRARDARCGKTRENGRESKWPGLTRAPATYMLTGGRGCCRAVSITKLSRDGSGRVVDRLAASLALVQVGVTENYLVRAPRNRHRMVLTDSGRAEHVFARCGLRRGGRCSPIWRRPWEIPRTQRKQGGNAMGGRTIISALRATFSPQRWRFIAATLAIVAVVRAACEGAPNWSQTDADWRVSVIDKDTLEAHYWRQTNRGCSAR
jgi:hypothetical protein